MALNDVIPLDTVSYLILNFKKNTTMYTFKNLEEILNTWENCQKHLAILTCLRLNLLSLAFFASKIVNPVFCLHFSIIV